VHCVMINRVYFSPQPRAVKNVYNAVGTNPSGTGTSSLDRLDSLCRQVCAMSRSDQVVLPRAQHQLATVLIEGY